MRIEPHLGRGMANHQPLTPLDFLRRAVESFPRRKAVIWGEWNCTYVEFSAIVHRLAHFLLSKRVRPGDVVSIISSNRPEMLAAHYAVPLIGAVLNSINTRLDPEAIEYILKHSESRLLIVDPVCKSVALRAAESADVETLVLPDKAAGSVSEGVLNILQGGAEPDIDIWKYITDEWQPICLNYTSGTTGNPKAVVYHHRGAYLNAIGNVLTLGIGVGSAYLWTLPMFHCNGWCHTWAVTAGGGIHVCLDRIDPAQIFDAIERHGVTHMSCAPVVLYMLLNHPDKAKRNPQHRLTVATGGASPTSTLIAEMDALGFDLIHLYGLTETYGPVTLGKLSDEEEDFPSTDKAVILARQGKRHATANHVRVIDGEGRDVPADGVALGEIVLRGNTLMAGYYGDPEATAAAFQGGMFHTGDIAVRHPDGAIEIRDRSKDVIISGGENISSLEIESVLHQHPGVLMAAVVALGDPKWGEVPVAFIELKAIATADAEELRLFCRQRLAGFKVPRHFLFRELPKTATGKIQKFMLRDIARSEIA